MYFVCNDMDMWMAVKTDLIQIRVETHLKAAAEKAADLEQRSLSNWLRVLIVDRCKQLQVDTAAPVSKEES